MATVPTVRGHAIQAATATSITITLPAGSAVGDVAILCASGVWAVSRPTGWTAIDNQSGTNYNGAGFAKVLDSADISTGSVTVSLAGSGDATAALLVFVGSTVKSVRPIVGTRSGSGSTSVDVSALQARADDYFAVYISNRASSTNTFSSGSTLHTSSATSSSGALVGAMTGSKVGATGTASLSAAGTGYYVLPIAVEGANSSPAEVVTVSGTTQNLLASHAGQFIRFTNASTKTLTVQPNSTTPLEVDSEYHMRNVGAGALTIVAGSGVTITAPGGGTLVVPEGGTVTLKRVATDTFDLLGQTVLA